MKIAAKKLKSEASGVKTMPADLRDKLNGLSINEALERGIINDLGDENGKFIFNHATIDDVGYAIVQGYAIPVSKGLLAAVDGIENIIGDLRFQKGISTIEGEGFNKEWFRLSMPAGINLGAEIYTLDPQTVEVK